MSKIIILLVLGAAIVFVFLLSKKNHSEIGIWKLKGEEFIAVSEVLKKDKDFYNIAIPRKASTKNKKPNSATNKFLQQIEKIILGKYPNIHMLDNAIHSLLANENISRVDKINGLWLMLDDIGFKSEKSEYLLDALSTLLPIELTDQFIDTYRDVDNLNVKIKLINILTTSIGIANPRMQNTERLNFISEKIEEIQSFLKEDILHEQDPRLLSEGIHAYAEISDIEDVQELIDYLENNPNTKMLKKDELSNLLMELAVSTEDAQTEVLPTLLETIRDSDDFSVQQKKDFTNMIIEGLDSGIFIDEVQREIAFYLKHQEPILQPNKKVSLELMTSYYTWAEANDKIRDNDINLPNIIIKENNPLKVSSILLFSSKFTIQKIREIVNIENIKIKLESALSNEEIANENKTIIRDAIDRLK